MLSRRDASNKPLEWTGHHQLYADTSIHSLPATQGQRYLAAEEGRGRYRRGDGSEFGCPQSSDVDLTGSTSAVTSQTSRTMFMLTEIRRHANSGLFLLDWHQALVFAPESCVRLNGWSA